MSIDTFIATYHLQPHPEGGHYSETFRSSELVNTPRGPRSASTAIVFALERGTFSAWHRVSADEVWHHYQGGCAELLMLCDGRLKSVVLGKGPGEEPQAVVAAGIWQATRALDDDVLFGCTVAPGFDFADFELASPALADEYPAHRDIIGKLTR